CSPRSVNLLGPSSRRKPGPIPQRDGFTENTRTWTTMGPGFRRYRIHTSLVRHVSAKHRPYTSRPRSGEREGPIAEQWEGEGRPCYLFLRSAAYDSGFRRDDGFCSKDGSTQTNRRAKDLCTR